ncbi:TPA: arsenic resistance N-acetyltransferase ArsN2 [Pseudomonas aeruginosa]|uniref:arsenic resistance N-acetyltransferase ArsN2 n=1 Tax=Pseudomonas aeruginosa TaxID=287 RepID=UPI00372AD8AB
MDTPIAGSDTSFITALQEAGLPTDDLTEPGRSFFAYDTVTGERVGYGGFECMGRDVLVRSLVVLPHVRQRGLGVGMLALLLRRAFDKGGREAWLLTSTASPFFERAGFKQVERSSAPPAILATRQAVSLCPASAALFRRRMTR